MFKKILNWLKLKKAPIIIGRKDHIISRNNIDKNALKVLYRLHNHGYQAYLVGGGIRDLLIGCTPKDFDVVTDARPENVRKLFSNCRLIGRRFRLAHIYFGQEVIEVATFRAASNKQDVNSNIHSKEGIILQDNVYGTLADDVLRRDFTINAIYYNIADFSLVDYVGGLKDIQKKQIVVIGDPKIRYREDPVRMLRAVRFAAKLNFKIKSSTNNLFKNLGHLLSNISPSRLFDEYLKMFFSGYSDAAYQLLIKYELFKFLFPTLDIYLHQNQSSRNTVEALLKLALINTDERVRQGKITNPAFLIAIFLWYPLLAKFKNYLVEGLPEFPSLHRAMEVILKEQQCAIAIPRNLSGMIKEIWSLQLRLKRYSGRRSGKLFSLAKFRAAYDFLLLRAKAGEKDAVELADWWTCYINANEKERWNMAKKSAKKLKHDSKNHEN